MGNANGVIKKLTSAERSYYTAAEVREVDYRRQYGRRIKKFTADCRCSRFCG